MTPDYLRNMVTELPKWDHSPKDNGKPVWHKPPDGSSWWVPRNYDPPKIGDRLSIKCWGDVLGTVEGYEVCAGYLMVWVRADVRPDWHLKEHPSREVALFAGIEMEPA